MSPAAIALNRFGLGARPDDKSPADPKAWLKRQIDAYTPHPAAIAALPGTSQLAADTGTRLREAQRDTDPVARRKVQDDVNREMREVYRTAVTARVLHAATTESPFAERLVQFWTNHFAVSADKTAVRPFAGTFEAEAIRPHVMGKFEDMLQAVEHHPAMIFFLDQTRSVGPDSPLGGQLRNRPNRTVGLNENLAREIMELHTLGVRGGYTQADVIELARALTGWSVNQYEAADADPNVAPGAYLFRERIHEPGPRTILGRSYWESGERQARAVLRDLAAAPATARHIATKLARHFAGDEPPPALIERLQQTYLASGGDLPTLYRALIDAPECWTAQAVKFKTPTEWLISVLRATGRRDFAKLQVGPLLSELGQPMWEPGSPAGWDDIAARWAAPDALLRRVETASKLTAYFPNRLDPRTLPQRLLAREPSPATRSVIDGADRRETALALLMVAPEFQRR